MRRQPRARRGALAIALIALLAAAGDAAAHPGPDLLAQRGFGDRANTLSWSGTWFKGRLYIGTARSTACVENQTVDFYFPVLRRYEPNPLPNVRCPRNPYDLDLRAEIWRYTPRTGRWQRVYRSPADIRNPRARGKRVARDIAYRGMVVHRDRRGRKALFVGGVTANEYLPELARKHPPRLLRTYDGLHYRNIGAPKIVRRRGRYTDHRPIGFRSLLVYKGRLLVTGTPGLTGDGAIFVVRNPWRRRARFRQVSNPRWHVFEMEKFAGRLYAGLGSSEGYSLWRTRSLRRGARWKPIVTRGAGRGGSMVSVVSMETFRNRLYVGANGWFKLDELPNSELIRVGRDDRWSLVAGNPRLTADGRVHQPISGLRDGFENLFNAHFWRMRKHRGTLYLGTNDWSYMVQIDKRFVGLQSLLAGEFGFDVWASCDGRDWFPVTRNAYGSHMYDFGARTFVSSPRGMFVGTANLAHATKVWQERYSECSSLVDLRRATAARAHKQPLRPERVMTDVQRDGTVISWEQPDAPADPPPAAPAPTEPAPAPAVPAPPPPEEPRYRVLRAQFHDFFAALEIPPLLPGGFGLEAQAPIPRGVGAGVASRRRLSVRGPMRTIGFTTDPYFVDSTRRPGVRYQYQVVAETASGEARSGAQVVPDPRPPATFAMLDDGPRAAAASGARARWRRGDRRGALAALDRLWRAAEGDDERRDLIERLERRIRYHGVAGGP